MVIFFTSEIKTHVILVVKASIHLAFYIELILHIGSNNVVFFFKKV